MFEFQTRFPGVGNRHEHLTGDLLRGMANGQLKPGGRLPTEKELSASYHCSRQVVRHATDTLKHHGLVAVVNRSAGTMVLPGATQLARHLLRERDRAEDLRHDPDIAVAQPSGSYARDQPARSVVAFTPGAEYSPRRPTAAEVSAGTYGADEAVVDVTFPDGTTESYGTFQTTFKVPAPPPGDGSSAAVQASGRRGGRRPGSSSRARRSPPPQ